MPPLKNRRPGEIDFGKTAADYRSHRAGFPDIFFERLFADGRVRPGNRVLDLGTGTGTIARGLALRGCDVTALDKSEDMLTQARALDETAGVSVTYRIGQAENTGLPGHGFDLITAGQCWHWFARDRAAAEAKRLLRPGGCLVIAHFDWLPLPGNVVAATEALILDHNPGWTMAGGTGIYPDWFADVATAGFVDIEPFGKDIAVPYSHIAWRGRIRASAGVGASLSPDQVSAFDKKHAALLARDFPADPLTIPHRLWALIACAAA